MLDMGHQGGSGHDRADAEGGPSGEESHRQSYGPQEFRGDDGQGQGRGHAALGRKAQGLREAVPSEPSQDLLGSMRENDYGQAKAQNQTGNIVRGPEEGD